MRRGILIPEKDYYLLNLAPRANPSSAFSKPIRPATMTMSGG